MSEKDIERWHATVTPRDKAPQPWTLGSGGSWDMLEVQPIPDSMLAELAQRYHYAGTPWNCRSMPLSAGDREYMYLLYSSMQGLVARMRQAERQAADIAAAVRHAYSEAMAGATEAPSRGEWDDGFREGVKAVVTVVAAALPPNVGGKAAPTAAPT